MLLPSQRLDGADILVLSPTPTWPLDFGNRKRIYSVCEKIKQRGARIYFLHYPGEGDWRHHYPKLSEKIMTEQWGHYNTVPPTRGLHESSRGDDHLIDEWWDEGIGNYLKWYFSGNYFDAVIVNYTWLSKALDFVPPATLKVLDTHDRFSNRGDLLESHGIKKEFFHLTQNEEAKGLQRADLVWSIKKEEEEFFSDLLEDKGNSHTRVTTLLHIEEHRAVTRSFPYKKNGYLTIGMIGARNNINITNTKAFLRIAIPIFEKYMTPVKIVLAGTMCDDMEEYSHPFVEMIGRVESVDAFYAGVDAAIVPMTFSTGLKIKVGEALAFGVPLIAHRHAFEGYPPSHRLHQLESIEEIAMEIVKLAYDPGELTQLRKASRESQRKLAEEVDTAIDDLARSIKEHRKTVAILLPETVYKASSFYRLHLEHVRKMLSETYRVILYYPYELDEDRLAFLESHDDWSTVCTQRETTLPHQITTGISLKRICEIWNVKLLWNFDRVFDLPSTLQDDGIAYIEDRSFRLCPDTKPVPSTGITVDTLPTYKAGGERQAAFRMQPFAFGEGTLRDKIWKSRSSEDSGMVYILFSGTIDQYRFWKVLFDYMAAGRYRTVWIAEMADREELSGSNHIDVMDFAEDVSLLKSPARIAFEINLANSHLIASTAWMMHVSGRIVIRPRDMSGKKGGVTLDDLHRAIPAVIEDLEYAKRISEFYHIDAADMDDLDSILAKYRDNKLKRSLGLK